MKLLLLLTAAALGMAGLVSVQPTPPDGSHENLAKEMLGTIEETTKVLKTIQDPDSAAAARPELKKAALKIAELQKQTLQVKQPTKDEKERLEKEFVPKMEAVMKKFHDETLRVKTISGGKEALLELPIFKDNDNKGRSPKSGK